MANISRTEVIDPRDLPSAARKVFARELYDLHCRIFRGIDFDRFSKYVVNSSAERNWIFVFRNAQGERVGYAALHAFRRTVGGERCTIFRAEAGMLREYRGGNHFLVQGLARVIPYMLARPFERIYYLGALVHPSSYAFLRKYAPRIWPCPGKELPAGILELMEEMADEFELEKVSVEDPLLRKVGWQTAETDEEKRSWKRKLKPDARYFAERNPGYPQGDGLLTLVPISMPKIGKAMIRFARERLVV